MKTVLPIIIAALLLSVFAGCNGAAGERELFTVDFHQAQTLRYKFVSSRDINIDWGPIRSGPRTGKHSVKKSSESMEMVIAYTPIEIDPYGLTTIKATCESVRVNRRPSQGRQRDAVESLAGKTFTLTVSPTGKIEDYSQLDQLIKEIGQKAFRPGKTRIKEPDMICDFISAQWFLWDSVSSIEKAAEGVSVGQNWNSQLSVPTPMVSRKARDVTYTLDEIRQSEKGRLAVIRSTYSLAKSVPRAWPIPYSGRFQAAGQFGFFTTIFKGFNFLDLQGQGEELFNIDAGRIEQYNQQYLMHLESASMPLPGAKPRVTIKQNLTMQLIE